MNNSKIEFPSVRIHNEHQLSGKSTKSKKQRKSSGNAGAIPSPIVESLTTTASVQNNPEDVVLNAVNSILPTEPLQRSELPGNDDLIFLQFFDTTGITKVTTT